MQNAIMRLATIVNVKFNDNANFETTFAEWEYEIHRFNASVDNKFQDGASVGILIAGTTGKLHDHLCLTLGNRVDYSESREVILNYVKSKHRTTLQRMHPMGWTSVQSLKADGKEMEKEKKKANKVKQCVKMKTLKSMTSCRFPHLPHVPQ